MELDTSMDTHFSENHRPLSDFQGEMQVNCPSCGQRGIVRRGAFSRERKDFASDFCCTKCLHREQAGSQWHGRWIGSTGPGRWSSGACGHCGNRIAYQSAPATEKPGPVVLSCTSCGQERSYPLYAYPWQGSDPVDPFFGLALRYQEALSEGILWVYNRPHLSYLQALIASKQRLSAKAGSQDIAARLPGWVLSARNREKVLRALARLEEAMEKDGL